MDQLHQKLVAYQHELAALIERKRSLENAAAETAQKAAVIEARIQGINEAVELLGERERDSQGAPKTKKRQRSLSGPWKAIMASADLLGPSFSYDDLETIVATVGHEAGRDTLRSQMSGYRASGLVESVGDGRFALTDAGRVAAGIDIAARETGREEQDAHNARIAARFARWVDDGVLSLRNENEPPKG